MFNFEKNRVVVKQQQVKKVLSFFNNKKSELYKRAFKVTKIKLKTIK
jgi:hypothetical protein